MPRIRFEVHGTPQPQGSKTGIVDPRSGKVRMLEGKGDGRERFHAWRDSVKVVARGERNRRRFPVVEGPVGVRLWFYMPKPRSKPKWKWLPDVKPDIDKLQRSILDALSKTLFGDDGQVVYSEMFKLYVEKGDVPRVEVEVWGINELGYSVLTGLRIVR